MREPRHLRALRGTAATAFATFTALVGHVAAGAELPGPHGILIPFALALPFGILLAGHTVSLARLSVSVFISQLLFHLLFVLGTGDIVLHTGHAHHGAAPALTSGEGAAHAHSLFSSSPEMMLAHGLAAIATIAAFHRGERAALAVLQAGRRLLALDRALLVLVPAPEKPAVRIPLVQRARCRTPLAHHARARVTRGPPHPRSH